MDCYHFRWRPMALIALCLVLGFAAIGVMVVLNRIRLELYRRSKAGERSL